MPTILVFNSFDLRLKICWIDGQAEERIIGLSLIMLWSTVRVSG